jgi:hypothetical protein
MPNLEFKTLSYKVDHNIREQMIHLLMKKESVGIFLFGTLEMDGQKHPFFAVHEGIKDSDGFIKDFTALLAKYVPEGLK